MKIIIPMAGMGKRMRPHTLTIPKPLIRIAGKPIVQRLAESISAFAGETVEEIAFVIGDFGSEVENTLLEIAGQLGAKGRIYYQTEPLGTAHAVNCAAPSLSGNVIVAFADTLFRTGTISDMQSEGIIWVHKVEDPRSFGVVKTGKDKIITGFVEKPQAFVSDLAIIGIYYFRDGEILRKELQHLIDNRIMKAGEYQLTDVLENMLKKGMKFAAQEVEEWLDCGNKDATVYTNHRILEFSQHEELIHPSVSLVNSIINKPCYIGQNVHIENSIIGPYVSVGRNSRIDNSVISNSIIQTHTVIRDVNLENSMIGNNVEYNGTRNQVSIGDYTVLG